MVWSERSKVAQLDLRDTGFKHQILQVESYIYHSTKESFSKQKYFFNNHILKTKIKNRFK